MSRWLKSVNNLLETLDGQAEHVADVTDDALTGALRPSPDSRGGGAFSYTEETLEDEEEFLDEDEEEVWTEDDPELADEESDGGESSDNDDGISIHLKKNKRTAERGDNDTVSELSISEFDGSKTNLDEVDPTTSRQGDPPLPHAGKVIVGMNSSSNQLDLPPKTPSRHKSDPSTQELIPSVDSAAAAPEVVSSPRVSLDESPRPPKRSVDSGKATSMAIRPPGLAEKPPSAAALCSAESKQVVFAATEHQSFQNKLQALEAQMRKSGADLKASQSQSRQLQKQVQTLTAKLDAAEAEIKAQRDELMRAGERMEKDRQRAQEEREEILDDHDDEIDQIREEHKKEMADQKNQYETLIAELQARLDLEAKQRVQEGGDWTKELEDALQRERDAIKRLSESDSEKKELQSKVSRLESQQAATQTKLESALVSAKTAAEREREIEDRLESTLSLHARQLSQRQARESELEQTVLQLGTALTVAQQKAANLPKGSIAPETTGNDASMYKDKYMEASEELETVKVQLAMETQRREALQEELNDISRERTEETSTSHARQLQYDRKVADLEAKVSRLQSSLEQAKRVSRNIMTLESTGGNDNLVQDLDEARKEVSKLTDQLVVHQGRGETYKSEILALKGRLQAANARAEEAERSLYSQTQTSSRLYEMEGGVVAGANAARRRRFKGGGRLRNGSTSVRSIRSALQLGTGTGNSTMEQVAVTIDALDTWMIDTGSFLRQEPMARLGLLLYICTLHLWSFALVVFHTSEVPHGDFGSMDTNPRHWRPQPMH